MAFPSNASPSTVPTDTPLLKVLRSFEGDGYTGQFRTVEGAAVECLTCHETTPASSLDDQGAVRLEGASDPSDMLIVVPVTCGSCQIEGTIVANYGPEASADEAELLIGMEHRR